MRCMIFILSFFFVSCGSTWIETINYQAKVFSLCGSQGITEYTIERSVDNVCREMGENKSNILHCGHQVVGHSKGQTAIGYCCSFQCRGSDE